MTAARPYRMTPLTTEQALAELRKFAGVQFDPVVVDAFVRTRRVEGVPDAGRRPEPRQIPLIAQAADAMTPKRADGEPGTTAATAARRAGLSHRGQPPSRASAAARVRSPRPHDFAMHRHRPVRVEPSVLILGILLGLVLGLLAGGSLANLAVGPAARWVSLLVAAVDHPLRDRSRPARRRARSPTTLRLPLLATLVRLLLVALWANRSYPGLSARLRRHPVQRRSSSSSTAATCRSGSRACVAAGLGPADVSTAIHTLLRAGAGCPFLLHLGPLADVIPIPFPLIQNVASIGDVFLTAGPRLLPVRQRRPRPAGPRRRAARGDPQRLAGLARAVGEASTRGRLETGLSPAFADSAALERPLVLGRAGQRCRRRPRPLAPARGPDASRSAPARGRRAGPPAPVRPARAQRLVLGAVDRPADLAVRRPAQPDRARRGRADLDRLDRSPTGLVVLRRRPSRTCSCSARSPARSWTAGTTRRC